MQEYREAFTDLQVSMGDHVSFGCAGYYTVFVLDREPKQFVTNRSAY